jgi:hypothetical protein
MEGSTMMRLDSLLAWFNQHQDNLPTVIHRLNQMDDGGVPAWTGEFATYLDHAAHATFAEIEERKVHEGTAAEQATLLRVTIQRYKYPMHSALHTLKRCRAKVGEPKPHEIGVMLIATRGSLTASQEWLMRKYPLMLHREIWLEAAERTLHLLHQRYTETPRAIVRGKSDSQLNAEVTNAQASDQA